MAQLVSDLIGILDPQRVLHEREHLLTYGFDGTAALNGEASVVVFPQTTEEVAQIVRYAAGHKVPIVSRGSGTGLSGGSIPAAGAIVLCLVKMDRILELDERNLTLWAEAGAITQKIAEAADSVGCFIRRTRDR
jgi:glycolate oxidase